MTPNQFIRAVKSYQHRKKLSLNLDDLESEITTFLTANDFQGKPIIIAGWKIHFDGKELSVAEAPYEDDKQLQFEWKEVV